MAQNVQSSSRPNRYGLPFTVDPEKLKARVYVQSEIHNHNKPSLRAAPRKPKERQVFHTILFFIRVSFCCRNYLVHMENWSH